MGMTRVTLGVLALVWCAASGCVLINDNLRTVERGQFYRSGQMDKATLARTIARHDVKTVINFRGANPEEAWYRDEVAVCHTMGVTHHDFKWSKNRLPEPESLAEYVRVVMTAERPILAHCQGGTHRSGVGAACYVLLETGDTEEARKQIDILFFNDAPIGRLLDLYQGSPKPFAQWVVEDYPALYESANLSAAAGG